MKTADKKFILPFMLLLLITAIPSYASSEDILNIGDTAPEFPDDVEWLGGAQKTLAEMKGKKAVLLYFLKPGCGSCDKFAPHLKRLLMANSNDLEVIAMTNYDREKVNGYIAKRMGNYPVVRDPLRTYMNLFIGGIEKYPYLALIGKDGKLKWFGRGKFHSHVTDELNRELKGKPETKAELPQKSEALVIAVPLSRSSTGSVTLKAPLNDAQKISAALQKSGSNVKLLLQEKDQNGATVKEITDLAVKTAKDCGENGNAIVCFSGEAIPQQIDIDRTDLQLLAGDAKVSLSELYKKMKEANPKVSVIFILDVNQLDSAYAVYEDIAAEVGKAVPEATVLISAARWDRSNPAELGEPGTIFTKMFCEELAGQPKTVYEMWRSIRDRMAAWCRVTRREKKGIKQCVLQTPFLTGPADIYLKPGEKKETE